MKAGSLSRMRHVALLVVGLTVSLQWAAVGKVADERVLWQNMPLIALLNGFYAGNFSLADAMRHGDFGLGAFADLDGEMIVDRGITYRVRASGAIDRPAPGARGAFAAITTFRPDTTLRLPPATSLSQLANVLRAQMAARNGIYAIRLSGRFAAVTTRAPRQQPQGTIAFCEVVKTQATFPLQQVRGTMVGYWTPDYLASVAGSGYHLHFISGDEKSGGHVLTMEAEDVSAALQRIDTIATDTPQAAAFHALDLIKVKTCPQ